jgi:acetylglutamate kinase
VRVLIKVGGTLLEDAGMRANIACQLAELGRANTLVVVHGGGKQVTQFLTERGIDSHFVRGLRVSDEPVIEAVTQVIAGSVNKRLVSALIAAGQPAVGLSGVDGPLVVAERMEESLGYVGKPGRTDGRLLDLLGDAGYIPVIACIAGDREGHIFNVNADQMAVSCAAGWGAEKLLFLTDVSGVEDGTGNVVPHLDPDSIRELVESGVARGGMRAKLEAAEVALKEAIREVTIANGREPEVCRRLLAGETIGTRVAVQSLPERSVTV